MSGKKLLILERSQSDLLRNVSDDGTITLEGIFTEFGVRNKNNRIYEEREVLPHINELKEKVKVGKLLGELDHPKDFDISLSNVSHVIESLDYDPEKKQVIGRIRLLNTSKGKEAQALIKDGIPLHISSRAAGTVDESGKVKIKKFFTYDLVADPGFENAELSRVNESYGFENDDTLIIYEMDETENIKDKKESIMENQNQYVTVEDFQKYTEYVKGVLNNVKESSTTNVSSNNTEIVEKLIKYTEQIAEKVNQLGDYAEYLSENLDKSISFSDYLAENVNQIKSYATYLAEELDSTIKYAEHVAEKADQGIQYSEHLAEKLDQGIQYSEHLAEKLDQGIQYSEHIAEKVDQGIKYSEHVAEKVDQAIEYANYLSENVETGIGYSEYVAEKVDQTIAYSEHLAEGLNNTIKYAEYIAESVATEESPELNESVVNESIDNKDTAETVTESVITKSYTESIDEKLDTLIAAAKQKVVKESTEMHFMNFLSEAKKNEFKSLSDEKQQMIVESMNTKPIMSTSQAENVWESCFIEKRRELNFIDDMPEKYQVKWASLSESRKNQIIAESKFHNLTTPYSINNFWATRDLRPSQFELEQLTESKTAAEQVEAPKVEPLVNESFANELINKVKFKLGRY
jgi:hypothetical protein